MNLKLGHIEIFVKDPLKSRDFYAGILGFELIEVQGDKYVWMKMGDNEILLRPGIEEHHSENYRHANMAFVIYTDNLEESVKVLTSSGLVFNGNDGPNNPTFTDLDGNWFQLANPAS